MTFDYKSNIIEFEKEGKMKKYFALCAGMLFLFGCDKLEQGSIAGKVTNGSAGQKDAIVLALAGDSLTNGQSINYNNLKGTLITKNDGSYKILLVDEGSYVVTAIKDNNGNLVFEDSIDALGYYGHKDTLTGLTIPEKINISKGEDKTGINIDTLYIVNP